MIANASDSAVATTAATTAATIAATIAATESCGTEGANQNVVPGVVRDALLVRAQRLGRFTIAWNTVEAIIAITAARAAGSSALGGFGFDSVVESLAGAVLLWRLGVERRDSRQADRVERIATKVIGTSFVLLAMFVAYEAVHTLVSRTQPDSTFVGIALSAVSLVVMPILARRKRRVAVALASKAAEAESAQTAACAYLSAIVLAGLALNATLHWWWADPVAALVVVAILLNEGRRALGSRQLDDCC